MGRRDGMASNEVRIIGGKWRGRKLAFPGRATLRPTLGRVRETLFNWLRADITDSRCLDLYAGSGALGFEALSRGAAGVTFVDIDRAVTRRLAENARTLGAADQATVICDRAEQVIRRSAEPWDIVFLDPPFDLSLDAILPHLIRSAALAAGGILYVETSRHSPLPSADWRVLKQGRAGETQFGLLATP